MNADPSSPWWKGARGEWFVFAQFALGLLVLFGLRTLGDFGAWSLPFVYAAAVFALLDVKSRHEERWLVEKFLEYPAYQRRVRKLIPLVY